MKLGDLLALVLFLYALLTRKKRRYTASWWQRSEANGGGWEYREEHFNANPHLLRASWFGVGEGGRATICEYMVTKRRGV